MSLAFDTGRGAQDRAVMQKPVSTSRTVVGLSSRALNISRLKIPYENSKVVTNKNIHWVAESAANIFLQVSPANLKTIYVLR